MYSTELPWIAALLHDKLEGAACIWTKTFAIVGSSLAACSDCNAREIDVYCELHNVMMGI